MALTRKQIWKRYYDKNRTKLLARNRTQRVRRMHRDKHLRKKYGITLKDYAAMLKAQGGRCAICRATPRAKGRRIHGYTRFAVDHDHRTGKIRGLLCAKCNAGLGFLKDDVTLVAAAYEYIAAR